MTTHTNGATTNGTNNGAIPELTFYTDRGCPWAHRAYITLRCLNLPYTEVLIPLNRPRDPWYLKEINPRGLVPSLKITTADGKLKDEIITESATVATFLADMFPDSKFWPKSEEDPLRRARIGFFADTWMTKINTYMYPILIAGEEEEKERLGGELIAAVEKEIEPLLENARPFFGGSGNLTFAEAMVAPFVIRYRAYTEGGLFPSSLLKGLDALPNYSRWSKAVCAEENVTFVFDGPGIVKRTAERLAKMKADAQ